MGLAGLFAAMGLCVCAFLGAAIWKNGRGGWEKTSAEPLKIEEKVQKQDPGEQGKEELAQEYCRVLRQIEDYKAEEPYTKAFLRYAGIYQALFGLYRLVEQGKLTDEGFVDEVRIELDQSGIQSKLDQSGYLIQDEGRRTEWEECFRECMALSREDLEKDLEGQRKLLLHYQSLLSCKGYLEQTGGSMVRLVQAVGVGDAVACKQQILDMKGALERQGCLVLFWDAPMIAANAAKKQDFLEDPSDPLERPGLYFKNNMGQLVLIGTCVGTRRAAQ